MPHLPSSSLSGELGRAASSQNVNWATGPGNCASKALDVCFAVVISAPIRFPPLIGFCLHVPRARQTCARHVPVEFLLTRFLQIFRPRNLTRQSSRTSLLCSVRLMPTPLSSSLRLRSVGEVDPRIFGSSPLQAPANPPRAQGPPRHRPTTLRSRATFRTVLGCLPPRQRWEQAGMPNM
jgi:hypothetical protein